MSLLGKRKTNPWESRSAFTCPVAGCTYSAFRYDAIDSHVCQFHSCGLCGQNVLSKASHKPHCTQRGTGRAGHVGPGELDVDTTFFSESARAHKGVILFYEYTPHITICMLSDLYDIVIVPLRKLLLQIVRFFVTGIRVSFRIVTDLEEINTSKVLADQHIGSQWSIIIHPNFISSAIQNNFSYLIQALNMFNAGSSQWSVQQITRFDVHVGFYSPPGNGRGYMPIPLCLKGRNGLQNIKSKGSQCFEDCVLYILYRDEIELILRQRRTDKRKKSLKLPVKEIPKIEKRAFENSEIYDSYRGRLIFDGITIDKEKGVSLLDISIFEENNKDISVSVYKNEDGRVYPVRCPTEQRVKHVNLLLLENQDQAHYVAIENYEIFMGKQGRKAHVFCTFCQKPYRSERTLSNHVCGVADKPQYIVPNQNKFLFDRLDMTERCPYVLYYKIMYNNSVTTGTSGGMKKVYERIPIAFSLVVVDFCGKIFMSKHSDPSPSVNVMQDFIVKVLEIADELIFKIKTTNNWIKPTPEILEIHMSKTHCDFCKAEFTEENPRHFDHSHDTGLYRNTLDFKCNSKRFCARILPCLSLSTSRYDFHSIISGLETADNDIISAVKRIRPFAKLSGEIIGLQINEKIKFLDIRNFKDASLIELRDELVEANGGEPPEFWLSNESESSSSLAKLMTNPLSFPQFDTLDQFHAQINKPGFLVRGEFNRTALLPQITDKHYNDTLDLFNVWGCRTLGDYLTKLSQSVCLLIASVFEFYRRVEMNEYGLDPACCYTDSAFTWNCCWKWTGEEVEYVQNKELIDLVEAGLHGGLLHMTRRVLQSNTPRYGPFDPTKDITEILYADISGSYAFVMESYLPQKDYQIMSREEIDSFNFKDPPIDTGVGWIFSCFLHLPDEFHDSMSDLPFCPEKRKVKFEYMSEFQSEFLRQHPDLMYSEERLLLTLWDKEKSVQYYKFLAFLVRHGYVIKEVYCGFKFTEAKIFESYVKHNTKQRSTTTNKFMRDSYKAKNNKLSGRCLKSDSKYSELTLCFNSVDAKKLISSHRFSGLDRISDDITLFRQRKMSGIDRNFRIIGMVILALGKLNLFEKYLEMKRVFGDNMSLVYSHTDSLIVSVIDNDSNFIKNMLSLSPFFDFSNLPTGHPLYSRINFGVAGVLKIAHDKIIEFLGVKGSSYSLLLAAEIEGENVEVLKCGGIPRQCLIHQIKHENYRKAILGKEDADKVNIDAVRVVGHDIFIVRMKRIGLGGLDVSRHLIDNFSSLPFGHHSLKPRASTIRKETQPTDPKSVKANV